MAREFDIIAAIRPLLDGDGPGVPLGTDDDAAIVAVGPAQVAVAVDTLVEDIHFDRSLSSLDDVGWKALAVNLSDLAAVGARPLAAVVSLQRPPEFSVEDAEALYRGMRDAADDAGCHLVGGDTVGSPTLTVSVTVLGVPQSAPLRRSGATAGDVVVVIGPLGLSAAGLALAQAGEHDLLDAHPELFTAHRRPRAQLDAVDALVAGPVTAAIDVSDGLGRDLAHIARQSGVEIRIGEDRLPVAPGVAAAARRLGVDPLEWVVGGGDDYAIAATVGLGDLPALAAALAATSTALHTVGEVRSGDAAVLLDTASGSRDVSGDGWEHE